MKRVMQVIVMKRAMMMMIVMMIKIVMMMMMTAMVMESDLLIKPVLLVHATGLTLPMSSVATIEVHNCWLQYFLSIICQNAFEQRDGHSKTTLLQCCVHHPHSPFTFKTVDVQ